MSHPALVELPGDCGEADPCKRRAAVAQGEEQGLAARPPVFECGCH